MNAKLARLAARESELSKRMAERGSLVMLNGPLAERLHGEVVRAAGITPE